MVAVMLNGQELDDGRSLDPLILEKNGAAVLLNNIPDNGQAQAPAGQVFCADPWLENTFLNAASQTGSGIADGYDDLPSAMTLFR